MDAILSFTARDVLDHVLASSGKGTSRPVSLVKWNVSLTSTGAVFLIMSMFISVGEVSVWSVGVGRLPGLSWVCSKGSKCSFSTGSAFFSPTSLCSLESTFAGLSHASSPKRAGIASEELSCPIASPKQILRGDTTCLFEAWHTSF